MEIASCAPISELPSNMINMYKADFWIQVLAVRYAPVCEGGQEEVYGVAKHETIRIRCNVDSNPADSSLAFKWSFNDSREILDIQVDTSIVLITGYMVGSGYFGRIRALRSVRGIWGSHDYFFDLIQVFWTNPGIHHA